MSLVQRIAVTLLTVQIVSLGLGTGFVYKSTSLQLRQGFAERVNALSDAISMSLGPMVCRNSKPELDQFLARVSHSGNIEYIILRQRDFILASSGDLRRFLKSDPIQSMARNTEETGVYSSFAEVTPCKEGEPPYELEIGVDFKGLNQSMQQLLWTQLASLLFEILLLLTASFFIGKWLEQKMLEILQGCTRISVGQFDVPIQISGKGEFAEIARTLNTTSSSLKELLQDRDRQRLALTAASKLSTLGEMAGGVAHEINNPLAILSGRLQQIDRLCSASEINRVSILSVVDKCNATVLRISKIVTGLRLFSRDADQDPKVPYSLKLVIEESLDLSSERLKNAGVALSFDCTEDQICLCRPTQISQVIVNLLNNAFDAILDKPEKWIKISLTTGPSKNAMIRVVDCGTGISPEVIDKIMHPFFTTKGVGKGTGLGLSISTGIIEEHGGILKVDPTSPHTCFLIELPVVPAGVPVANIKFDPV